MGLHDRDYYRDEYASRERWHFGYVTMALAIAVFVPFLIQIAATQPRKYGHYHDPLMYYGGFVLDKITEGEVWRVFTAAFLHDAMGSNLWLLGFSVFVLLFCGRNVESTYGSKEVFWFYVFAILISQLAFLVACQMKPLHFVPPDPGYGSGGATAAILVLFACIAPDSRIPLMVVSIRSGHLALAVVLANLVLFGTYKDGYPPAIPILTGAVFALAYHRFDWRVSNWIPDLPGLRASARPPVVKSRPVFQPEPVVANESEPVTPRRSGQSSAVPVAASSPPVDEQLEARVDEVLEKVSQFGRGSLTPQEERILQQASEIYKKRRSPNC
jgi:membrane associated rhomboid family serine protease